MSSAALSICLQFQAHATETSDRESNVAFKHACFHLRALPMSHAIAGPQLEGACVETDRAVGPSDWFGFLFLYCRMLLAMFDHHAVCRTHSVTAWPANKNGRATR